MYKYPFVSIQMVIIVVFDQLSYFKRYYTFVLIILTICYIHPIEKTLSGESINQWWCNPMVLQELWLVWEAISKTRKSVSSGIQTPRSRSKKLGCASFFKPTSRGLDILMKHSFSCLIYYITNRTITDYAISWYICARFARFLYNN